MATALRVRQQPWAVWALDLYLRLVSWTARVNITGPGAKALPPTALWAVWHGRGLAALFIPLAAPRGCLVSKHGDGQLVGAVAARRGWHTVAGSSGRHGVQALRQAGRLLRAGTSLLLTPDGPRGPRMVAQGGALLLARQAQVKIIPVGFSARWATQLHTWDRYLLPLPGSMVTVWLGQPLAVNHTTTTTDLEAALTAAQNAADRTCGRTPVAPANAAEQALAYAKRAQKQLWAQQKKARSA